MNATTITITAGDAGAGALGRALVAPMKDLDTYRVGRVWHTIWHRDQQPHGTTVDAIKQLGGGPLGVGQSLVFQTADEQILGHSRVTGIRIMDPALATTADIKALGRGTDRSALQEAGNGSRCWYVTFEPVRQAPQEAEHGRSNPRQSDGLRSAVPVHR